MLLTVAHRLLITLEDSQHRALRREHERTGASMAAIVRRVIDQAFPDQPLTTEESLALLERGFGAWANRPPGDDPIAEWRAMRPPMGPGPQ
jgi:hypothetical protein